jgi:hypothetical protein
MKIILIWAGIGIAVILVGIRLYFGEALLAVAKYG